MTTPITPKADRTAAALAPTATVGEAALGRGAGSGRGESGKRLAVRSGVELPTFARQLREAARGVREAASTRRGPVEDDGLPAGVATGAAGPPDVRGTRADEARGDRARATRDDGDDPNATGEAADDAASTAGTTRSADERDEVADADVGTRGDQDAIPSVLAASDAGVDEARAGAPGGLIDREAEADFTTGSDAGASASAGAADARRGGAVAVNTSDAGAADAGATTPDAESDAAATALLDRAAAERARIERAVTAVRSVDRPLTIRAVNELLLSVDPTLLARGVLAGAPGLDDAAGADASGENADASAGRSGAGGDVEVAGAAPDGRQATTTVGATARGDRAGLSPTLTRLLDAGPDVAVADLTRGVDADRASISSRELEGAEERTAGAKASAHRAEASVATGPTTGATGAASAWLAGAASASVSKAASGSSGARASDAGVIVGDGAGTSPAARRATAEARDDRRREHDRERGGEQPLPRGADAAGAPVEPAPGGVDAPAGAEARATAASSRPDPAQAAFEAQVARGLAAALQRDAQGEDGAVTLRLSPASLGPLRVRLEQGRAGLIVRFEAGSAEAARRLEKAIPQLAGALERRGIAVERAGVERADAAEAGVEPGVDAESVAVGDGWPGLEASAQRWIVRRLHAVA